MKRLALLLLAFSIITFGENLQGQDKTARIDVLFVLDTTGSMGGLIASAKDKIWSIANTLAQGQPAPKIRMGLVGYRDKGDAYVTKFTQLADDLDSVYSVLMAFRAGGGGDGPEHVNRALHEAVTEAKWDKSKSTYKVIFLVGDAPPHMDYNDYIKYKKTCRLAKKKGIVINTVQCGSMSSTTPHWKRIAQLGGGEYFRVNQSGGAIHYSTPYDKKLSKLSRSMDSTRVYYGTSEERGRSEGRMAKSDEIYSKAKT